MSISNCPGCLVLFSVLVLHWVTSSESTRGNSSCEDTPPHPQQHPGTEYLPTQITGTFDPKDLPFDGTNRGSMPSSLGLALELRKMRRENERNLPDSRGRQGSMTIESGTLNQFSQLTTQTDERQGQDLEWGCCRQENVVDQGRQSQEANRRRSQHMVLTTISASPPRTPGGAPYAEEDAPPLSPLSTTGIMVRTEQVRCEEVISIADSDASSYCV